VFLRILVVYPAESSSSVKIAEAFREVFAEKGHIAKMEGVRAKKKMRVYDYIREFRKKKRLELAPLDLDVKQFDLIVVGTPVRRISGNFSPAPEITTYLRELKNTNGKKFALFSTCIITPGSSIKKMSNILTTKGATVKETITVKSVFELDGKKLKPVKDLAARIVE